MYRLLNCLSRDNVGQPSLKNIIFFAAGLISLFPDMSIADEKADQEVVRALREEIRSLQSEYRARMSALEIRLKQLEAKPTPIVSGAQGSEISRTIASKGAGANNPNAFNPAIGIVLNGRYSGYSAKNSGIAGFAVGEEGERKSEGLLLDESEVNASASVDDKFAGAMTAALVSEDGEDIVEIEEAYIKSQPGLGLPSGLRGKFGRSLWNFGYLNEHHTHADDFADRPLPYRAFLNNAFNDDGLQLVYVLPTDLYTEVGGGAFRGAAYPFGGAEDDGVNSWLGFVRVGGDIGENHSWRIGGSFLGGSVGERSSLKDSVKFSGDTQLYGADLRYTWAPTGNSQERELTLQAEYIWRNEDGGYLDMAANANSDAELINYRETSGGFYAQAVYKFLRQWRVGARYSLLTSPDTPEEFLGTALDAQGHDPQAFAVMFDWTNSEFSRLRFQYNYEELSAGEDDGENDHQFILQYIMSLGAHGAHAY